MDPWNEVELQNNNINETSKKNINENNFEDNFEPDESKLPDSEEYLAALESKLEQIKRDPNLLKQLADKRNACMHQLLTSEQFYAEEPELETPITTSSITRVIAPETVALNQGEIVELVKHDQLTDVEDKR